MRLAVGDGAVVIETAARADDPHNGLLALPPPVNAHDHGYGIRTLDFGCPDDALEPWIAGLRKRPVTDPYVEALVAFGRLALNGCAATMHCHNSLRADRLGDEVAAVVRAGRDCGIALAVSCPMLDASAWVYGGPQALRATVDPADWPEFARRIPHYPSPAEQVAAVEACIEAHRGAGVDIQFGPIGPQWCSDALLEEIAEASERTGARIHMHLLESPRQRRWLDKRFGGGVVAHLDRIGFLSPRLAVAHGVQLRADECDLLAERGVIVVSNPSANLRLRSGIAPVDAFRKAGLAYAIGLDGTGFSDDQDIWQELRLFHLLHGGQGLEPAIPATELFDAAMVTGSAVLNRPHGTDLVTVDFGALTRDAIWDEAEEASLLLSRMCGRYVRDLYVAGHEIVGNGRLRTFDFDAARDELVAQARGAGRPDAAQVAFAGRLTGAIRRHYLAGPAGPGDDQASV